MKDFARRKRVVACWMAGAAFAVVAHGALGQVRLPEIFAMPEVHSAKAPGYLGVEVTDVDAAKAQTLKLKDTRGAVVTLIDHDAPAGQAGLRLNDVVVQLNGQPVEGAKQLKHMLHDVPAGTKIVLGIVRDGAMQTVNTELADRREMERSAWNKLGSNSNEPPVMGFTGSNTGPDGFHMPSFGNSLRVGAVVEPLNKQMAAHLGVSSGLMVKQVERRSDAEKAGLIVMDVILKVGPDAVATVADWERAMRANQGKQIAVTVLRDGKQQTMTLDVGARHRQSKLGAADAVEISSLGGDVAERARVLRQRMDGMRQKLSQKATEQLQKQVQNLLGNIIDDPSETDLRDLDHLRKQLDQLHEEFSERFA